MKAKIFTCFFICVLLFCPAIVRAELIIYDVLQMAEKLEMYSFTAAVKMDSKWVVKGLNIHNDEPAEIHFNTYTGIVDYSLNITPKEIVIGDNVYGYSGNTFTYSAEFYQTGLVYNGLKLYRNNSRYFAMRHAIFINNMEGFVAYYMIKGPDMTK